MEHGSIAVRELKPEELEMGLTVRNSIFSPINKENWQKGDPKTAAIALSDSEAIGFIPLYLREFRLTSQIAITAAFENAVGVRQDYRGTGIGSQMIDAACHFLKGKADALYVYRGDERSQGYNFYAKTGHVDLLYMRIFENCNPKGILHEDVIITQGTDEIYKNQQNLMTVFDETYYSFGGFPIRNENYWERAFNSSIFASKPMNIYFLRLVEKGYITAYLIAGNKIMPENEEEAGRLHILELAACGGDSQKMKKVLETTAAFAEEKGFSVIDLEAGDSCPFGNTLTDMRYSTGIRRRQIMSLSFDSKALFNKVWKKRLYLPGIELKVWTPKQEITLVAGKDNNAREVTIEMKEEMLTRWLMGRLNFNAGINEGTITVANGNKIIINEIARTIGYNEWEYHPIDYI